MAFNSESIADTMNTVSNQRIVNLKRFLFYLGIRNESWHGSLKGVNEKL